MSELDPRLEKALGAARREPANEEFWDELEDIAGKLQKPDEVGELYREVLAGALTTDVVAKIGPRAVGFHEEWFGDDAKHIVSVLTRILELDPSADWALQRATVVLTVREKWNELLSLYDRALEAATEAYRRSSLLEEAAQLAKDFAGQPDRAVGYLRQLLELRPEDAQLEQSIERLLERIENWTDLVGLWRRRLEVGRSDEKPEDIRLRIVVTFFEKVGDAAAALAEARAMIDDGVKLDEALAVVERILSSSDASVAVRNDALEVLRARYVEASRNADVERVLGTALAFTADAERIVLHRELGRRTEERGDAPAALEHWAAVLGLDPADEMAEEKLVALADSTGAHVRLAEALEAGSRRATQSSRRVGLLLSAADVRAKADRPAAEALYREVLDGEGVAARFKRDAARRLAALLDVPERRPDRLAVLERVAELETEQAERRRVLGLVARLATELGEIDRALSGWQLRLSADAGDVEALEARIELLDKAERHAELAEALVQRAALPMPAVLRRDDLVRAARVLAGPLGDAPGAIATWQRVEGEFGEDRETVDALSDLYARTAMHAEHAAALDRAATRDAARAVDVLSRLASVQGEHLGDSEAAATGFLRAIQLDARHAGAREGLVRLLERATGPARQAAVEGLADAALRTDDVPGLLDLLPHRLGAADSDRTRVRLLREAARLEESRRSDPGAAFDATARAFALSPEEEHDEREILRLADLTTRHALAAAAFAESARALEASAPARAAHLHREASVIFEEKVADSASALAEGLLALTLEPHDGQAAERAISIGARLGEWSKVAHTWIDHQLALRRFDADLTTKLEAAAASGSAWDALSDAADQEIAARTVALGGDPAALRAAGVADVMRALEDRLAVWHRDKRGDLARAEAALSRALGYAPTDVGTLRELARLQWRAPGKPLVTTLITLSQELPGDLDALHDAARIAKENVGDPVLVRELLAKLFRAAERLWQRGEPAKGERPADKTALEAHAELVRLEVEAGRHKNAVDWLIEGARLPVAAPERRALLRRAGDIAREKLGDESRAMQLYQSVVDDSLEDSETVDRLGAMYEQRGRVPELLALKKRELELPLALERKLEVRLAAARLLGALEEKGGRVELLRQNLNDRPGHPDSITEITSVLEQKGKGAELVEVIGQQARKLEETDGARAALLWAQVARTAETRLQDSDRAISSWRRVVTLEPGAEAYDALARLHLSRSEPGQAAEWLEKRFDAAKGTERIDVAMRLADARISAGRLDRAIVALERALGEDAAAHAVREKLLELYRQTDDPAALAKTLAEGVKHVEPEQQLAYVREAQVLYRKRLAEPAAAIAILELVHARGDADQELRGALAEGYLAAGRLDEAKALLEAIVLEFGRRRSSERALVHFQLARVAQAAGDLKEALDQLDKASSMDLGHPGILRLQGQLAREAGQADRSERAYRALLLLVRRQAPDAEDVDVGQAEVLWELSRLAKDKGQDAQARELYESSIEAARTHEAEAARFTAVLLARGDGDLAEKILDVRLETSSGVPRARALADKATLLDKLRGKPADALGARLEALDLSPDWKEQASATLELARRTGQAARFVKTLEVIIDRSRRKQDAGFASDLLLRLGDVLENDVNDLPGAADAYGRAEALGVRTVDAWRALGRVAQKRGDRIEEIRILRRLVSAGVDTSALGGQGEIPEGAQTDALYRIADVELKSDDTIESGLDTLADAVKRDGDHARAAAIARGAAERIGSHDGLFALWERAARQSGKDDELLAYLMHRTGREGASLEDVREGSDLAVKLGAADQAETILERGVALAGQGLDGLAGALWILTSLSERRRAAGDTPKAIEWTKMAIDAADQAGDGARRDALLKDLAAVADAPDGDPALAAETYARLLDVDPKDRSIWGPMTAAFKKVKDRKGWEAAMRVGIDALFDPADRSALRMALAEGLRATWKKEDEAIAVLREVLDDDPDHLEGGAALGDIYERRGMQDELRELLARQLDRARDRGDARAVVALSLRTGSLYGPDQRADAMDVYRGALDWAADDADILRALYGLYGPDDDARDRATLGERLLAVEVPGRAGNLALEIADQLVALEDEGAALSALATGFRSEPTHGALRERLEAAYRSRDDLPGLAEMLTQDASGRADVETAVARYREAAALWTQIGAPEKAAEALGAALERAPMDATLLDERVAALEASGRAEEGLAAVTASLEGAEGLHRASLLRAAARLRMSLGDVDTAVVELEEALGLDAEGTRDSLGAALEARRDAARDRGDRDAERAASMRLVEVLDAGGDADGAREALATWVERDGADTEALRALLARDLAAARWSDVIGSAARLVEVEVADEQMKAALTLAEAARRIGAPEAARAGLERAYTDQPERAELRNALRALYEASGAHAELAEVLLGDAQATEGDERFEALRRAGDLLVNHIGNPARAIEPLQMAHAMKPDDLDVLVVLVDSMIGGDQLAEAVEIIQAAINVKGRKRSPQLAGLQQRMGRIAGISGDAATQLEWLKVALDTDKNNGAIAAEVAELAIHLGEDAIALNALKVVTLQKVPGPMSKAVAFLRQAQIMHKQGDHQKAVLWARRARIEDAELTEAETFLGSLGEG